jgi:radical SAM superfamily enzyme YgiQ (UPF0313 family)
VDEAFYDLPEMISTIRKAGLTFAPESATGAMREAIGKGIDMQVLCRSASIAFKKGWRRLKLYFMVGFPQEDGIGEAEKIFEMARNLSELKREASGGAAEIKVSVNPFVPKPHTPLQWLGMKEMSHLEGIRDALLAKSTRKIKIEFHDLRQSLLEACLSRGDRRVSGVIYAAWKKGAKMDSWNDFFDLEIWKRSFAENGLGMRDYANRVYGVGDPLPWAHIKTGMDQAYLMKELEASGLYVQ